MRAGLIDDLAYEDEIDDKVDARARPHQHAAPAASTAASASSSLGLNRGPRIALIYAVGDHQLRRQHRFAVRPQVLGSDTMVEYLRKARADNSIRAIVLGSTAPAGRPSPPTSSGARSC